MKLDKNKINIEITAQIGSIEMTFDNFINLDIGSKIKMKNMNENNINLYANNVLVGKGELIVADNKTAVKISNKY